MGNVIEEKDTEKMKLGKWIMGNVIEEKYTTHRHSIVHFGGQCTLMTSSKQIDRQTATICLNGAYVY